MHHKKRLSMIDDECWHEHPNGALSLKLDVLYVAKISAVKELNFSSSFDECDPPNLSAKKKLSIRQCQGSISVVSMEHKNALRVVPHSEDNASSLLIPTLCNLHFLRSVLCPSQCLSTIHQYTGKTSKTSNLCVCWNCVTMA